MNKRLAMTDEEYVRAGGLICPICGKEGPYGVGGGFDIDGDYASNKMRCPECDSSYYDRYKLNEYLLIRAGPQVAEK